MLKNWIHVYNFQKLNSFIKSIIISVEQRNITSVLIYANKKKRFLILSQFLRKRFLSFQESTRF